MLRVDRTTAHRDINIAIYQKRDGERSNYTTKVVCTNFEPKRDKIKVPRPIQPILLEKPSVGAAYERTACFLLSKEREGDQNINSQKLY